MGKCQKRSKSRVKRKGKAVKNTSDEQSAIMVLIFGCSVLQLKMG